MSAAAIFSSSRWDESGISAVRRLVRHHVEQSIDHLCGRALPHRAPPDEAIHAARKALKRARAELRLLRDALGRSVYSRENAVLRDAARPLSRARDGKVLLARVEEIARRRGAATELDATTLEVVRRALRREHQGARDELADRPGVLRSQLESLRALLRRSERWPLRRRGLPVLGRGLKRTYARGRRALAAARAERSVVSLHEWRKQAKYLWHQLQLFEAVAPRSLRAMARKAHRLSDYLGEDHDLAVLHSEVERAIHAGRLNGDGLLAAIDRRRIKLQRRAFDLGSRLYRRKPRALSEST